MDDRGDDVLGRTMEQRNDLPRRGALLADRYRILGLLGAGGMGSVHRVLDTELDEEVALKLLRADIALDGAALLRFRREVKLARRVTHANVARTYDLGVHGGTRFITMELIEGEPLSSSIRLSRRLTLAESLRVAGEIAGGLAAAHAVGVVHRDLKPDNVMLSGDRVVLTDFGIARASDANEEPKIHHTVGAIGTPAYMAPEQVEGRALDGRADVYALGVVLFECLTGRLPFEAETPLGMAAMRLTGEPPDPRTREAQVPAAVAELVLALLARARERRPDAQSALEALDRLRGQAPAKALVIPHAPPPRGALGFAREDGRWSVVTRLAGADNDAQRIAMGLDDAIHEAFAGLDGFARVRGVPGGEALDDLQLARRSGADLVLGVTVRAAGARIRVRLKMSERTDGHALWQHKIDGERDDPFALEDELGRVLREYLSKRFTTPGTIERGPSEPKLREVYGRARALMLEHDASAYASALALLEEAHASAPEDPWILSRLAAALVRRASLPDAATDARRDEARAEELALRALANDSSIADTYQTLGILRWMQGRMRSAVLAFREALARDPFLVETHGILARLADDSGRGEEALERAQLVERLLPSYQYVHLVLSRAAILRGDREQMEVHLAKAATHPVALVNRFMFACWHRDAESARRVLDNLSTFERRGWLMTRPMRRVLRHILGEEDLAWDDPVMSELLRPDAPERSRAQSQLMHAELIAMLGAPHEAILDSLEAACRSTVDLSTIDRSPSFDRIRATPRYAQARAIVAARVAEVWA